MVEFDSVTQNQIRAYKRLDELPVCVVVEAC